MENKIITKLGLLITVSMNDIQCGNCTYIIKGEYIGLGVYVSKQEDDSDLIQPLKSIICPCCECSINMFITINAKKHDLSGRWN